MPYFDPMRGAKMVPLDDGYYVVLRHLEFQESLDIAEAVGDNAKEAGLKGLTQAIVEWNLDDKDGIKPITEDAVRKMRQSDIMRLTDVFSAMEGAQSGSRFPDKPGQRDQDGTGGSSDPSAVPHGATVLGEAGPPLA